MTHELGSIDHLSQVISQVVAPSFLRGAVASFISLLFSRVNIVVERLRTLNVSSIETLGHYNSKGDIPRLRRQLRLLQRAALFAICSGIAATVLIILAFATALLSLEHVWGAAILFIISLTLLCASLVLFAIEVTIGLSYFEEH